MRVLTSLLGMVLIAAGCAQPVPAYFPNLDKERYARVNFRGDKSTLYSSNYLSQPVLVTAGSPVRVTMFSDLKVNMTVHGAMYSIYPVEIARYDTGESSIQNFLEKYFVDTKEATKIDAAENEALKPQILVGQHSVGMTKEQIYMSLGPPAMIDGTLPAGNLPLKQIMQSDRWKYAEQVIVMVPTWKEFIFFEGKLQTTNPP